MTRTEIESTYRIINGRIQTPGQFEGEAIYLPYYWDIFMEGGADDDDGQTICFHLDDADQKIGRAHV